MVNYSGYHVILLQCLKNSLPMGIPEAQKFLNYSQHTYAEMKSHSNLENQYGLGFFSIKDEKVLSILCQTVYKLTYG